MIMHSEAKVSTKKRDDKVQSSKVEKVESAHPGAVEKIGKRVREIRESLDKDTSQDAFSKRLGLSLSKLNRIENGRRAPDVDFLLRLKKEFSSCDLNWLLAGEGSSYQETTTSAKTKLLALLKDDKTFRQVVMVELDMLPASEVVRDPRIVDLLKAQRTELQEINALVESDLGREKLQKKLAYLDALLLVGQETE